MSIFVAIIRKIKNMNHIIHCFVPFENEASVQRTIASLRQNKLVGIIYLMTTTSEKQEFEGCPVIKVKNYTCTETYRQIARYAETEYTLIYTKTSPLELGYRALERMSDFILTETGMVYSDFNEQKNGEVKKHPVIDYQFGSVRDDGADRSGPWPGRGRYTRWASSRRAGSAPRTFRSCTGTRPWCR